MSLPVGSAYQLVGTNSGATAHTNLTLAGTANQIIIGTSGTTLTLTTPQNIGTGSSPTFAGLTLTSFSGAVIATAGVLSAGTLAVANGGTGVTASTGSIANVLSTSPTLVTPILGVATATSITFNPTTGGIVGTTTNDNAAAGKVGEYVSSVISTPTNFPTSTNYGDLTSISLTAGDWDVSGVWSVAANGAVVSFYVLGITITSGNSATGISSGDNAIVSATLTDTTYSLPGYRQSVSGTTIIYLKYRAGFTGGPPQATGRLSARRVR